MRSSIRARTAELSDVSLLLGNIAAQATRNVEIPPAAQKGPFRVNLLRNPNEWYNAMSVIASFITLYMVEKKPPRTRTPLDVETAVLANSARRCALCFFLKGDLTEKLGQIAHLDQDRANGGEDNLAWMCLDHHSLFDSQTKQHKNYTIYEVKTARAKLYELVAAGKHITSVSNAKLDELRISALQRLHEALVKGHYELNRRAKAHMPKTEQEFRTLVEVHEFNFLEAFTMADIYLHEETKKAMAEVLGSFRQMCTSIWLRLPEVYSTRGQYADAALREPDWGLFTCSFDGALAELKKFLNPINP